MIQTIDQNIEIEIQGAQSLNYNNNQQLYYPERLRSQYFIQQDYLNRLRVIYFQEFVHQTLEQQIQQILEEFCKSSYVGFSFYPALDTEIDWESTIGVANDGICLCDNETQLGYLYLSYDMFEIYFKDDYLTISLRSFNDEWNKYQQIEEQVESIPEKQLDRNNISLFQKSMLKLTQNINLPVYTKINLQDKNKGKYDGAITNFQVFHSDDIMDNEQDQYQSLSQKSDISNLELRRIIKLKMKDEIQIQNLLQLIEQIQYQVYDKQIQRNLRIQSQCQTQLFYSQYMNYCIMYCAIPNKRIIEQIREINEYVLLRNQQIIYNYLNLEDQQMCINDLRAFCDSLNRTLNYNKDNQTIEVDILHNSSNGMKCTKIKYMIGNGTPYSPFVPVQSEFYKNLLIQKIQFKNNGFDGEEFIKPIIQLLKNKNIQKSLNQFTYKENLLKQNGCIQLSYYLSFCKKLQSLELIDTKCNSIGLSCLLYLLYTNGVCLLKLSTNIQLKTMNQVQQLANYIIFSSQQNQQNFTYLNCTNVFYNTNQCDSFVKILQQSKCRIKEVQMEDQEFQKILIIKSIADEIEI